MSFTLVSLLNIPLFFPPMCRCHHKGGGSGRSSVCSAGPRVRSRSEEGHPGDSGSHDGVESHQRQTGTLAQTLQGRSVCHQWWVQSVVKFKHVAQVYATALNVSGFIF